MVKKLLVLLLCMGVLIAGFATYKYYTSLKHEPDYSTGVFVDRGESATWTCKNVQYM